MSAVQSRSIVDERRVREISKILGEPSWLAEKRVQGLAVFDAKPFPFVKDEGWKYTDPRKIKLDGLALSDGTADMCDEAVTVQALDGFEKMVEAAAVAIHCNGRFCKMNLPSSWLERGVQVLDWRSAIAKAPDLLKQHFMSGILPNTFDKFTALHSAAVSGGLVLLVPDGVELAEPLFSIHWLGAENRLEAPHLLVLCGKNSSARFVDVFAGPGGGGVALPAYEFNLEPNCRLNYIRLQQVGQQTTILGYQKAIVGRDANLITGVVNLGGRLVRDVIQARMQGSGSEAKLLGAYMPGKGQHFHHETLQEHAVPYCHSDLLFKGALSGDGRAVFGGMIKVFPGAQKTDAYQKNRNLILSKEARADSIPQLEIRADDVKCSHGATVSQVQENELFYLQSRGLRRPAAEELLVFGFIDEVLAKMDWPEIVAPLECRISARIKQW
ncbi:MAG: Fe-S cluster assembly protein SufD [bacterium]|jgi:Fe-S cluster assembly protein SufD